MPFNFFTAPENFIETESKPEMQDDAIKVPEPTSVCQLQQPLLMRRSSSPSIKTAVPYSESNAPAAKIDVQQTEIVNSRLPSIPVESSTVHCNQNNESMNLPNFSINSSVQQSIQSTPTFTGYQNQPILQSDSVIPSNNSQSMHNNQESNNLRQQNIFPPPPTAFTNSTNFPSNNIPGTAFSSFPEKGKVQMKYYVFAADYS